jgi:hypothetical protein
LYRYSVELKGGCREWQDEVVAKITSAVLQSGGDLVGLALSRYFKILLRYFHVFVKTPVDDSQ